LYDIVQMVVYMTMLSLRRGELVQCLKKDVTDDGKDVTNDGRVDGNRRSDADTLVNDAAVAAGVAATTTTDTNVGAAAADTVDGSDIGAAVGGCDAGTVGNVESNAVATVDVDGDDGNDIGGESRKRKRLCDLSGATSTSSSGDDSDGMYDDDEFTAVAASTSTNETSRRGDAGMFASVDHSDRFAGEHDHHLYQQQQQQQQQQRGLLLRGPGPCYAFNDGNCMRGDSCRYSHDGVGGGGAAADNTWLVSSVEMQGLHSNEWKASLLPRLYAFARTVYEFRSDDSLRLRYLSAGDEAARAAFAMQYLDRAELAAVTAAANALAATATAATPASTMAAAVAAAVTKRKV
jgi:hypothetical protein